MRHDAEAHLDSGLVSPDELYFSELQRKRPGWLSDGQAVSFLLWERKSHEHAGLQSGCPNITKERLTIYRLMGSIAVAYLAITLTACGSQKGAPHAGEPPIGSQERTEMINSNNAKQEAAQAALCEQLKADPQPLFDFAVKTIKEILPEQIGDENGKQANITVDTKSLKTFGAGKWAVRGHLSMKGAYGDQRETTWQVRIAAVGMLIKDPGDWRKNQAKAELGTDASAPGYAVSLGG
jgi:hypothetical protein